MAWTRRDFNRAALVTVATSAAAERADAAPRRVSAFTHLYNMSGQPSMSLPLAFSGDGLPIGVMLSGRVGDDSRLFSLAAQIEGTGAWSRSLPPVHAGNVTGT